MSNVSPGRLEAFRILLRVERDAAFSTPLLAAEALDALSPEDRGLAHELVLGVLRWRGELDYLINAITNRPAEKLDAPVRVALWIGLYQMRHLKRIPEHAAVNESVELVKSGRSWRAAPLANAALRKAARENVQAPDDRVRDPLNRMSIALSHPRWMLERWIERFGEDDARALAESDNEHPPTALRINPLRAPSNARVMTALADAGVAVVPSKVAPGALVVEKGTLAPSARAVKDGWVHLQDEASQLVAHLVDARPGDRVLDIGAAPGGKTSHMAAAMANNGQIVAVDVHPSRLSTLVAVCRRLAANIVRPVAADAASALPFSDRVTFDRVLLDAPCSGTGTLRRNPEIRWRLKKTDLERFAALQSAMLDHAADRVRPGGRLVYSTCSLEREEDEAIVEAFLAKRGDFHLVAEAVPEAFRSTDGFLRVFPHRHGADGFFAAVLELA